MLEIEYIDTDTVSTMEMQKVIDIINDEKNKALERCQQSVLMRMEIITLTHDIVSALYNENLKKFKRTAK